LLFRSSPWACWLLRICSRVLRRQRRPESYHSRLEEMGDQYLRSLMNCQLACRTPRENGCLPRRPEGQPPSHKTWTLRAMQASLASAQNAMTLPSCDRAMRGLSLLGASGSFRKPRTRGVGTPRWRGSSGYEPGRRKSE
jgi:hypothetical protein